MKIIFLSSSRVIKQATQIPKSVSPHKFLLSLKRIILTSIVLIIFLLSGSVTKAQLSYIASASATGDVITLPGGWTAGDLALVFAFRAGSNLYPLSPDFTEINRASRGGGIGGGAFGTLSYRLLQTSDNSFTFTDATEIQVIVLRGSATVPVSQSGKTNGKSVSMRYAELVYSPLSSSWIVGFGGHQEATNVYQSTASPMTIRSANTATKLGMHSLTGVTSFPQINWSTVNTSSNWITICAEILENPTPMYFQSAASGDWRETGTWQQSDDGGLTWDSATRIPNSNDLAITILSGHTVYATATLTSYNNLTVYGTYEHRMNGGTIPAATWDINSTCLVTGIISTAPSGLNQNFGNFEWNCISQATNVNFSGNLQSIQGTFTLTNTGGSFINAGGSPTFSNYLQTGGWLMMTNGTTPRAVNITHDFSLSGGEITLTNKAIAGTVTVGGDFSITGGTIIMSSAGGTGTLNVAGNFTHTGGTITETSTGIGDIVFNGTSTLSYTSGGTVANQINFTVNNGASLYLGTSLLGNGSTGTFTLTDGGTLGIGDAGGITVSDAIGNIRVTGTRTYNTGANYIYNGTETQSTGNGLPATVNNLTFNNSAGSVLINAAHTINNFSITTGSKANLGTFTHLTNSLSLGGVGQQSGTYGHSISPATNKNDTYFDAATGVVNNQPPDGTWIGATSTDWNTTSNWIGGVPTSATNAIIPSGPVYQPIVLNTPLAECNNLTIESGASLTIDPSGSATITSLINNGTLNLQSDETGIASLVLDSYTDNGTENIELLLTGGDAGSEAYRWHYISFPVVSPFVNLYNDVQPGFNTVTSDLARFEETEYSGSIVIDDSGWITYDGYRYSDGATVEGFSNLELGKGYNYYHTTDQTYTFSGTLNTSAMIIPLAYSGESAGSEVSGFNMLGNPFTSGLNWDAISNSVDYPANTSKAVFFTKDNIQYTYVNGVGTPEGANGNIPPMQGFFVKTSSTGNSLPISLIAREHNTTPRYKGEGDLHSLIRLSINENDKLDETVIRFNDLAKADIDLDFDAVKMYGASGIPSISSRSNRTAMTINGLPFPDPVTEIPLVLQVGQTKNASHTIKTTQLQRLDDYRITLTDKLSKITVNLKNNPDFTFTAPEGLITDRFVLKVEKISTGMENPMATDNQFNIYHAFGFINVQTLSDEWEELAGTLKILSTTGKMIMIRSDQVFSKSSIIQIPEPKVRGIYLVELTSGLKRFVGKVVIK